VNKYVVAGLLAEAAAGKLVLVVSESTKMSRYTLELMSEAEPDFKTYRAHGQERVETPAGGSIRFTSPRSTGHRGVEADVCFVDCDLSYDEWSDLAPTIAAGGEMMRA
jgi:hypothetical protein